MQAFKRCYKGWICVICPLIFILELKYTRQQGMDCFSDNNIHVINPNVSPNYDACSNWCGGNSNCGGYTVQNKKCYFTRKSCNNNLPINGFPTEFIPQGNYLKYNNILGSRNTRNVDKKYHSIIYHTPLQNILSWVSQCLIDEIIYRTFNVMYLMYSVYYW